MDVCVRRGAFVDVNEQIATKILTVVFTSEVMSELGEGKGLLLCFISCVC